MMEYISIISTLFNKLPSLIVIYFRSYRTKSKSKRHFKYRINYKKNLNQQNCFRIEQKQEFENFK